MPKERNAVLLGRGWLLRLPYTSVLAVGANSLNVWLLVARVTLAVKHVVET